MIGVLKFIFSVLFQAGHQEDLEEEIAHAKKGHGKKHDAHGGHDSHDQGHEDKFSKFKKMYEHSKALSAAIGIEHSKAYIKAVDAHLKTDDGGVDFDRLDKDDVQKKFVESMTDHYLQAAKKYFGTAKDLNDFDKNLLMSAYAGVTEQSLGRIIHQNGSKLTPALFEQAKAKIQENLETTLYGVAASHFDKEEHASDIIDYLGLGDRVKKDLISLDQAKALLYQHNDEGVITNTDLRKTVGAYKMKHAGDDHGKASHGGHDAHGGGHH